jgi:hypothetical protein
MRYCDDGHIEIDNSAAERALRAVAIGRNYAQLSIMCSAGDRRFDGPGSIDVGKFRHCT